MEFGKWIVTANGIEWKGDGNNRLEFDKAALQKKRKGDFDGATMYDAILLATEKDWLAQDDLYDFNFAFVYAASKFGFDFSYAIFDATLEEQFDQFDMEEDEDDDM